MPLLKQSLLTCLRGAGRTLDMLTNTMLFGAAISLCAIITAIIYEVVARFVFLSPTSWVSDLVVYLLLVTVFLAMPKVTAEAGHVSISIVPEMLPGDVSPKFGSKLRFRAGCVWARLDISMG